MPLTTARAALLGALAATLLGTGSAQAAPAPVTVTLLPTTGTTTTVQRVAPNTAGGAATWRANLFVNVRNTSSSTITVDQLSVVVAGTTWTRTQNFSVSPGATQRLQVQRSFSGSFPLPAAASSTIAVLSFDPRTTSHPLGVHRNETPTGAYKFPFKGGDFPAGVYVATQETQGETSHHFVNPAQVYAHDMDARRWTGSAWTNLRAGGSSSVAADYLIYDKPQYAVDEGTIIACRRTMPDQPIGSPSTIKGGGNFVFLRTGTGETVFYAHMRPNTISTALCPVESRGPDEPGGARAATPVTVKAGQFLGRTGTSGSSFGPHIHIEVFRGTATDVNNEGATTYGVPMHFDRFETVAHFDNSTSGTVAFGRVAEGQGAAMPNFALARAHVPCGWDTAPRGGAEWITVRSPACFQEGFNDTVNYGYAPMEIEGASDGSAIAGVFRPSSFGHIARHGLLPGTGAGSYQQAFDAYRNAGYSLLDVDSYVTGGAVRYNAVWTTQALGATIAYHGASASQHQSLFNQYVGQGYRPITITAARIGTGAGQYTAVYRKVGDGGFIAEFVRETDFQARFNTRTAAGYRPVFVDAFDDNGVATLSVIWTTGASGSYVMRHAMTFAQFAAAAKENLDGGRRLRSMTVYRVGGVAKYAAIWR